MLHNIPKQFNTITKLVQQDFTGNVMALFEANKELSNIVTVESLKVRVLSTFGSLPCLY